jgi:uncharacterized membrane protein YfcA
MLPPFSPQEWLLAALAAFCIGFSKSGFSGVGLLTVVIMARLFPPRESTGVLLPLLIVGDICSVLVFHQHALWPQIGRMLPPTLVGVVAGFLFMLFVPAGAFGPLIGWIVLCLALLQGFRKVRPKLFTRVPHTRGFAYTMGAWTGITTMLANAAGPVMTLYFLAINLPKYAFVGTSAWFFLLVNVFKVPFSAGLGLITSGSLLFNIVLIPCVAVGIFAGRALIRIIPQNVFEWILLLFAAAAAFRLIGLF